jgi:hypothetical protein
MLYGRILAQDLRKVFELSIAVDRQEVARALGSSGEGGILFWFVC